jgi:cytochrome P450 family 6
MKTCFLIGNLGELCRMRNSIAEIFGRLYEESKTHKLIGIYLFYRPFLLVNDPEVIQDVLIKNFQHFSDHGLYVDESYEHDPLSNHLFSLRGEKWKNLRIKLTPLFSPMMMRMMFPTFVTCAMRLKTFIGKHADSANNVIEFRDLFARYTTDVIASTAFGFENDSINEPNNEFRRIGQKVFQPSFKAAFRSLFTFLLPDLNKFVGVKTVDDEVESFMFRIVEEQIKFREQNNVQRNDFMQVKMIYYLSNIDLNFCSNQDDDLSKEWRRPQRRRTGIR